MADLTSIHGFRVAPLVKVVFIPESIETQIKIVLVQKIRGTDRPRNEIGPFQCEDLFSFG